MNEYLTVKATDLQTLTRKIWEQEKNGFSILDAGFVTEEHSTTYSITYCQNMVKKHNPIAVVKSQKELNFDQFRKKEVRREIGQMINCITANFESRDIFSILQFMGWANTSELNRFVSQEITNRILRQELKVVGRVGRGRTSTRICVRTNT